MLLCVPKQISDSLSRLEETAVTRSTVETWAGVSRMRAPVFLCGTPHTARTQLAEALSVARVGVRGRGLSLPPNVPIQISYR